MPKGCLADEQPLQDRRLNQAYQAVLGGLASTTQRTAVRQAQRRWLAERDQRCGPSPTSARRACETQANAHRADELAALGQAMAAESVNR